MKLIEWPYYRKEFLQAQGFSDTIVERFWDKVQISDGCWVWKAHLSGGYGRIGKATYGMVLAHVLSYIIHNGTFDEGLCVLHKCDNPPCVRPDHLFLGTRTDNIRDMDKKGRRFVLKGEMIGTSKLTAEMVIEMRNLYAAGGWGYRSLGRRFGVSERAVTFIIKREHWKHV